METKRLHFFNTTGPCNPDRHYMLSPEERLMGGQLSRYIEDELYWVLHAPRQTGKTTFLKAWMREINRKGKNIACYVTVEACQGVEEPERAIPALCNSINESAILYGLPVPETIDDPLMALRFTLRRWAELIAPKSLIVLFDEVDVLVGETLISFLRQLRGGFATRGVGKFPISIALVGMRDLKDYITASKDGEEPNPGSPFNIKKDSVRLANFSENDVARLFALRTDETGQQITPEALKYVFEQSGGQPWIVNSLFDRAIELILGRESTETVTKEHIFEAREQMILARETHLDTLAYRLKDDRVRRVIEAIIVGKSDARIAEGDEFSLCLDLGLVTIIDGTPEIANPIYREVIARQITYSTQLAIPKPEWVWQNDDGSLNINTLMLEFQDFWRQHSEIWEERSDYTEAFPHLLLMAFLQRVINGGGHLEREYAAGRGRMDLALLFNKEWYIIEIKIINDYTSAEMVRKKGLEQIRRYRDRFTNIRATILAIFDRREKSKALSWDEKISHETDGDVEIFWQ